MVDIPDRNQEATLFVGELDAQVTESLLWELFLQVGPVGERLGRVTRTFRAHFFFSRFVALSVNVHIPRDKVSLSQLICNPPP